MATIVTLYGLSLPVTKLISAAPVVIAAMRCWVAALVLGVFAARARATITRQLLRLAVLGSVFSVVNNWLAFLALQHMSVAVLSVLLALQPGAVLLLAGHWLGERATLWHIAWMVVGVLGVSLVVLGGDSTVRGDLVGYTAAVGSIVTFVGFYAVNRHVRYTVPIDAVTWNAVVSVGSAIAVIPAVLLLTSADDFRQLGGTDWMHLTFVVAAVPIIGHTLMSWVHKFIPAARSSLYLLGMNVVAVLAAWPINGEVVTIMQLCGGLVVLGALAAVVSRPTSVAIATPRPTTTVRTEAP
jgi:probable blue pigment (indigoidine) exporter